MSRLSGQVNHLSDPFSSSPGPSPNSSVYWMCPSCLAPYPTILCHCSNSPCSCTVLLTYSTLEPRADFFFPPLHLRPIFFPILSPSPPLPRSTLALFSWWLFIRFHSITELGGDGLMPRPSSTLQNKDNILPSAHLEPSLSSLSHLHIERCCLALERLQRSGNCITLHFPLRLVGSKYLSFSFSSVFVFCIKRRARMRSRNSCRTSGSLHTREVRERSTSLP